MLGKELITQIILIYLIGKACRTVGVWQCGDWGNVLRSVRGISDIGIIQRVNVNRQAIGML